jgi:hypothetical protein
VRKYFSPKTFPSTTGKLCNKKNLAGILFTCNAHAYFLVQLPINITKAQIGMTIIEYQLSLSHEVKYHAFPSYY